MEKSTKIGLGLFVFVLVVGFMFTRGGSITGSAVAVAGGPGEVVEINTVLQAFQYSPDVITVKKGSTVKLTIDNKDNVEHGLHLPQFGIVEGIPPLGTKTVQFTAVEAPNNGQAVPTCALEHGETLTFNVI